MGKVTRLPNALDQIEATVRRLALDSAKVFMTKHAEDRLADRSLTMTQVYTCLQHGEVIEGPVLDSEQQLRWKIKLQKLCAGVRVQVVCKLVQQRGEYVLVITVI